jgi:hypothetical protein
VLTRRNTRFTFERAEKSKNRVTRETVNSGIANRI